MVAISSVLSVTDVLKCECLNGNCVIIVMGTTEALKVRKLVGFAEEAERKLVTVVAALVRQSVRRVMERGKSNVNAAMARVGSSVQNVKNEKKRKNG